MNEQINPKLPLRTVIRVRRLELSLTQADVAEALRTEPEAVGNWERGVRRIDLDKLPRLARTLNLDERQLCRLWIAEFHAGVYRSMFPDDEVSPLHALDG